MCPSLINKRMGKKGNLDASFVFLLEPHNINVNKMKIDEDGSNEIKRDNNNDIKFNK